MTDVRDNPAPTWRRALEIAQTTINSIPPLYSWRAPSDAKAKGAAAERSLRAFAADPSAWTLHRMNALPGSFTRSEKAALITASSLGLTSETTNRPSHWAFARAPVMRNDPRHPAFSRVRAGSVVASSEERIDALLDAVAAGYATVAASEWPPQLKDAEESAWRKVTPQRGVAVNWYVQAQGPGLGDPLPPDFIRCLRHTVAVLISAGMRSGNIDRTTDPVDTNSGYPYFQPGLAGKMLGTLLTRGGLTARAMLREAEWLNPAIGLPTRAALAFGLSGRSGPLGKAVPLMAYAGAGRWTQLGEWKGFAQRNRVVQMGSAAVNLGIAPIYDVWVAGARATRGQWFGAGLPTPGTDPAPPGWWEYDSDLTGLDLSVSARLQSALADALHAALPSGFTSAHAAIDVHRLSGELPLITPSWDLNDSHCAVVNAHSGVHSGQKATGREDTVYSVAANLYALLQQGFDVYAWPQSKDFQLYNLGDDTRLNTARELNAERFVSAYREIGLTVKLSGGVTFLSKYEGRVGTEVWTGVPIAGRVVQQTLFNEHEATGSWGRLVAPVGLAARSQGHERWPAPLRAAVWDAIRQAEWIEEAGLSAAASLADAVATIQKSDAVRKLVDAAAKLAATDAAWLTAELRGAMHSPLGSYLASLLQPQAQAAAATANAFRVWQTTAVAKLSPSRARHYLIAGWHATKRGRGSLGSLALELLREATSGTRDVDAALATQIIADGGLTEE